MARRTESDFEPLHRLEPGEKCNGTLNASDPGCQEGLELPKNYDGQALIDFGRQAKPGEMYLHTSGSATAKGEMLAGLVIHNKSVAQVLPQIEARSVGGQLPERQHAEPRQPGYGSRHLVRARRHLARPRRGQPLRRREAGEVDPPAPAGLRAGGSVWSCPAAQR